MKKSAKQLFMLLCTIVILVLAIPSNVIENAQIDSDYPVAKIDE